MIDRLCLLCPAGRPRAPRAFPRATKELRHRPALGVPLAAAAAKLEPSLAKSGAQSAPPSINWL